MSPLLDQPRLRVNVEACRTGHVWHGRSDNRIGKTIRYCERWWEKRVCRSLRIPWDERYAPWGNHDGIWIGNDVVQLSGARCVGVGEALARGSVISSVESYESAMAEENYQVRVFEPGRIIRGAFYPLSEFEMREAGQNWVTFVENQPYDYRGLFELAVKALILDLVGWECGNRWKFWCTEGVAAAYKEFGSPRFALVQDATPTPMHIEQHAGLIPMKAGRVVTMREITSRIIVPA